MFTNLDQANCTPREKEVAELVMKGLSNDEIGQRLFITEKTVKYHLTHIFKKMKVNSRLQLVTTLFSARLKKAEDDFRHNNLLPA